MPDPLANVVVTDGFSPREADHLVINHEVGLSGKLALELKHSVDRTTTKGGNDAETTVIPCLLPTSRLLLLKTQPMRLLTGLEMLSIQGISHEHCLTFEHGQNTVQDRLFSNLAGNAFAGGCYSAMLISTLACVDFDEHFGR